MNKSKTRQRRAESEMRGTGERETYVPYIRVAREEFASRGRSHIFPSAFFDRSHHVLSDIELHVLWRLHQMRPWDIREQFPLQWEGAFDSFLTLAPYARGTVEIARDLGIPHPAFSKEDPKRMTTDFVVELRDGSWHAFHVKYMSELGNSRFAELRLIETLYWKERGIPLHVINEEQINTVQTKNLAMLHTFDKSTLGLASPEWLSNVRDLGTEMPMSDVTQLLVDFYGLNAAHHANLLKFSIATGQLDLDLRRGDLIWTDIWPSISIRLERRLGI